MCDLWRFIIDPEVFGDYYVVLLASILGDGKLP
jgi:hypothetical protein